jgi:hypothetical protein
MELGLTNSNVNKRVTSNNTRDKDRVPLSSGISKKYIIGAGKTLAKSRKPEIKKKNKYSNMKMLYQNAVYKSLNLNISPNSSSLK